MTNFSPFLEDKKSLTTEEALEVCLLLVNRYQGVIGNVLRIKASTPEEEGAGFRRQPGNTQVLTEVHQALEELGQALAAIEQVLKDPDTRLESDNPQLNKQLIEVVKQTVKRCERAYVNKSMSFAVVLSDLQLLHTQLQNKLNIDIEEGDDIFSSQAAAEPESGQSLSLGADEKLVFVRVFHKDMHNFAIPKAPLGWLKSLLDSIKTAEKHGLGVYATEEDVRRSLRGHSDGYATLRITSQQDITSKRASRIDPALGCPLLTITPVGMENFVKFTYEGLDYPFKDGLMRRPKATDEEK